MAAASPQALSAPTPSGPAAAANPHKRKRPPKGKGKKLARPDIPDGRRRNKPSAKFLKILKKRARDYNSDDDEEEYGEKQEEHPPSPRPRRHDDRDGEAAAEEVEGKEEEGEEALSSGDELGGGGGATGTGVTRFEQGCKAFRVAFLKIIAKKLPNDPLGPILSAHKTLVAAKLAEEAEEHKPKGEARKEKRVAAEKGHFIPKDHLLDSKEKDLIKIATQGVVRLFNAATKAQNPRKDLNPSRTKDAKILAKERKSAFLTELKKPLQQDEKIRASSSFSKNVGKDEAEEEPGWAPLRDTYMLGTKLKDWDKMQDSAVPSEQAKAPRDDSSEEE